MRIDFVFSARSALLTFSRSHRFGSAHFEVRAPVRVNRLVTIFGEQPARHCATMLRCCTRPRALAAPRITMGTDSTYRYYYFTIMSDSDCRSIVVMRWFCITSRFTISLLLSSIGVGVCKCLRSYRLYSYTHTHKQFHVIYVQVARFSDASFVNCFNPTQKNDTPHDTYCVYRQSSSISLAQGQRCCDMCALISLPNVAQIFD